MPTIIGKDDSKLIETMNKQAESGFYVCLTESLFEALDKLTRTYDFNYYMDPECKRIVNPTDKDIENARLELENDSYPNEFKIIIRAAITNRGRLLSTKEIYQLHELYKAYKEYNVTSEDKKVKIQMITIRRKY